jgi:YidC/Oxa1 family membrane protein insertase
LLQLKAASSIKEMDKNQVTGLMLIALIVLVYLQFFSKPTPVKKDPIAKTEKITASTRATLSAATPANDSLEQARNKAAYGNFSVAAVGEAKEVVLENEDIKVTFSTKGGQVKRVQLKKYLTYDKNPLILLDEESSNMTLEVAAPQGKIDLYQLYFSSPAQHTVVPAGDTSRISFRLEIAPNQYVEQVYSLADKGFQLGYDLKLAGLEQVIKNEPVRFTWQENQKRLEQDMKQSRNSSNINYYLADGAFEHLNEASVDKQETKVTQPVKWVSLKYKFFNAAIIAKSAPFQAATLQSSVDPADSLVVKALAADLSLSTADLKAGKGKYEFYFGPNNYQVVKKVTEGFGDNVYLGWPVVRWINQFVTVPVFNFLQTFIGNYGIIIIVLVLLVKLLLTPLTYKSYISMAKMRLLQPELAEIKKKAGDDAAKAQQDQMKLYQQVGVSPLNGCIPVLLTMPILFAMFSFFPSSIELRQQPFLWSHDLSTYDAIIRLPFSIPFTGDTHISLFAILMTISSVAYAYYNNQMTTVEGPMKTLGYIMPVVFLFVMNSFPAGLSFYYFVSNAATIAQQLIIRRFVNEDKIKLVLEENRKNAGTRKKSKFQTRMEEAMKVAEASKKKK